MDDIKQVVLVGGSTRIPLVQETVKRLLRREGQALPGERSSDGLAAAELVATSRDDAGRAPRAFDDAIASRLELESRRVADAMYETPVAPGPRSEATREQGQAST